MKRILTLFAVIGLLVFNHSAFAAGYGQAGCGLGSIIFGNTKGPVQIFAATTNGTSINQLFGITSGTSNCDATGLVLAEREQQIFVENNYESIIKEMAAGEGENLDSLSALLGCSTEGHERFASFTQERYSAIIEYVNTTPSQLLTSLMREMSIDPVLSDSCTKRTL